MTQSLILIKFVYKNILYNHSIICHRIIKNLYTNFNPVTKYFCCKKDDQIKT